MMQLRSRIDQQLAVNAVTLAVALVMAEALFKFRSFTLEAVAFLITWWVLIQAARFVLRMR